MTIEEKFYFYSGYLEALKDMFKLLNSSTNKEFMQQLLTLCEIKETQITDEMRKLKEPIVQSE